MNNNTFIRVTIVIAAGIVLAGCAGPQVAAPASVPDTRVALASGDELDIRFYYTPDLNDLQVIRADGKITLQLVGDVDAAGQTPSQLQKRLEEKYEGLIEKPSVAVIARKLNHRNIYVAGSVKTPGLQTMPGHLSALEAVMQAGGFDMRDANPENVIIIRMQNGQRVAYTLDLKDALVGKSPGKPFYLHAQDIVYVPRTTVVKVGQWVDQHIAQLIPQAGFTYSRSTGNSTIGIDTSAR
jgi:polysaccharide export outer membrane protein